VLSHKTDQNQGICYVTIAYCYIYENIKFHHFCPPLEKYFQFPLEKSIIALHLEKILPMTMVAAAATSYQNLAYFMI